MTRFETLSDALDREASKLSDNPTARQLLRNMTEVALKAECGDQHAVSHLARMIRELCKDRAFAQDVRATRSVSAVYIGGARHGEVEYDDDGEADLRARMDAADRAALMENEQ